MGSEGTTTKTWPICTLQGTNATPASHANTPSKAQREDHPPQPPQHQAANKQPASAAAEERGPPPNISWEDRLVKEHEIHHQFIPEQELEFRAREKQSQALGKCEVINTLEDHWETWWRYMESKWLLRAACRHPGCQQAVQSWQHKMVKQLGEQADRKSQAQWERLIKASNKHIKGIKASWDALRQQQQSRRPRPLRPRGSEPTLQAAYSWRENDRQQTPTTRIRQPIIAAIGSDQPSSAPIIIQIRTLLNQELANAEQQAAADLELWQTREDAQSQAADQRKQAWKDRETIYARNMEKLHNWADGQCFISTLLFMQENCPKGVRDWMATLEVMIRDRGGLPQVDRLALLQVRNQLRELIRIWGETGKRPKVDYGRLSCIAMADRLVRGAFVMERSLVGDYAAWHKTSLALQYTSGIAYNQGMNAALVDRWQAYADCPALASSREVWEALLQVQQGKILIRDRVEAIKATLRDWKSRLDAVPSGREV